MAGSNGILKYQRVNREDEIIDLKYRGAEYFKLTTSVISAPAVNLLASQLPGVLVLASGVSNALNGPTAQSLFDFFVLADKAELGASFRELLINQDLANPKTITFPAGFSVFPSGGNTLTIPAGGTSEVIYSMTSLVPPTWLITPVSNSSLSPPATVKTANVFFSPPEFRMASNIAQPNNGQYTELRSLVPSNPLGLWTLSKAPPIPPAPEQVAIAADMNSIIGRTGPGVILGAGTTLLSVTFPFTISSPNPGNLVTTVAISVTEYVPTAGVTSKTLLPGVLSIVGPLAAGSYNPVFTLTAPFTIGANPVEVELFLAIADVATTLVLTGMVATVNYDYAL